SESRGCGRVNAAWKQAAARWCSVYCHDAGESDVSESALIQSRRHTKGNHHGRDQGRVIQTQQMSDFVGEDALDIKFVGLAACREVDYRVERDIGFVEHGLAILSSEE